MDSVLYVEYRRRIRACLAGETREERATIG
jgi:hypothetical protein